MTGKLFEGTIKLAAYQMTKAGLFTWADKESLCWTYKPDETYMGAVAAEVDVKRFDLGQSE